MSNSEKDVRPHSRGRQMPELCEGLGPLGKKRAQGMPDARCTRGLVCNVHKEVRTRAYRAAESIRHSLRNGFTAYNALSPVIGSFATVACGLTANLTPAPRRQDHTSLPYALAPFVIGTTSVHRIPSHVRDGHDTPL